MPVSKPWSYMSGHLLAEFSTNAVGICAWAVAAEAAVAYFSGAALVTGLSLTAASIFSTPVLMGAAALTAFNFVFPSKMTQSDRNARFHGDREHYGIGENFLVGLYWGFLNAETNPLRLARRITLEWLGHRVGKVNDNRFLYPFRNGLGPRASLFPDASF